MANPASTKKQIVDSIKQANNILVTVSKNPSVDELSAALGLTIFLNKLDKHATAVFSGKVPPAITFLEPDKTFEDTADSLRDFIIALDKEKADHLRYKIVDDSVKIFITPYRTTITDSDLEFSQGDYNVELVIALNVENDGDLDVALTAHGKILHDAEVITVTAGQTNSSLGTVDWHDDGASGVSEMLTGLINEMKTAKATIDEQIASALLTGIVSATDRFGNEATSSRGMTAAATLIAAGANPHLIAAKLVEAEEAAKSTSSESSHNNDPDGPVDGSTRLKEGRPTKLSSVKPVESKPEKEDTSDKVDEDNTPSMMKIRHTRPGDLDDVAKQVMEDSQKKATQAANAKLDKLARQKPQPAEEEATEPESELQPEPEIEPEQLNSSSVFDQFIETPITPPDITEDLRKTTEELTQQAGQYEIPDSPVGPSVGVPNGTGNVPSIGGTLNATAAQAAEDKRRERERDQNQTILKHGKPIGNQAPALSNGTFNASMAPSDEPASVDVFSAPPQQVEQPQPAPEPVQEPSFAPPAIPHFEQQLGGGTPPDYASEAQPQQSVVPTLADIENQAMSAAQSQPPLPPMPDFSSLPPLPPMPSGINPADLPVLPNVPPNQGINQQDFNPSRFQIPS